MSFDGTLQEFTLNMHGSILDHPYIEVQQADTASRKVRIHLKTFNGEDYVMPYNPVVAIYIEKSDGKKVLNECEIEDQSTVIVTLTTQSVACSGKQKAQLYICNDDGDIKSQGFYINVPKSIYSEDAVQSIDEVGLLQQIIDDNKAVQAAEIMRAASEEERQSNEAERKSSLETMKSATTACVKATDDARGFSSEKSDAIIQTAEGKSILVQDSSNDPVRGLRVFGRTEQVTTTGAQLLDISNLEIGKAWNNSNNTERAVIPVSCSPNTTYTVSVSGGSFDSMYWVEKESEESTTSLINTQMSSFPFTRITTGTTGVIFLQFNKTGISISDFDGVEIMLNSGSVAMPWEPYTGGMPSPNPDYPQELVSAGDSGSVGVSVSDGTEDNVQSLTIATPNGLPGIQVTDESIANYTDADGKMWCCDEIDLERGVYVQRILNIEISNISKINNVGTPFGSVGAIGLQQGFPALCNYLSYATVYSTNDNIGVYVSDKQIRIRLSKNDTVDSINAFLQSCPLKVMTILTPAIETPLSATELSTYRALHTNNPVTTITNSDNAHMIIKYNADTKNYIAAEHEKMEAAFDAKLAEIIALLPAETQAAMIETETTNILSESEV